MKTIVIDIWVYCSRNCDKSDSSAILFVMSRIKGVQYPDLYWCCSFSRGYKNKTVEFGGTNRSISPRFTTAYNKETGIETHLYEQ